MRNYREIYDSWRSRTDIDSEIAEELRAMEGNDEAVEDAFGRDMSFGTGGLRGILGAGTDRMNIYTVARASQGLAAWIIGNTAENERRLAVSYDSRIKSDLFAEVTAGVAAANGIEVYLYPRLMPTPCLSFAVRKLRCSAGVMVTASHNPAEYNGYKVYGSDGCQITEKAAAEISAEISSADMFDGPKSMSLEDGIASGIIKYIPEDVLNDFVDIITQNSIMHGMGIDRGIKIVYSPLCGAGYEPVTRVLNEAGFNNIITVKEQRGPDGNFPTCPYPNPEMPEAMELGIKYAKDNDAEIFFATDPDSDRVGLAVRDNENGYRLLTGNQTGVLMFDFICGALSERGTLPDNPVLIKSIVTTSLADRIADSYGIKTLNLLTGFKYIGEQITALESEGRESSYVFGFEESCGYLYGTHARDKDAVCAALMICEMCAYYHKQGKSMIGRLEEIYAKYGFTLDMLYSWQFKGSAGRADMNRIIDSLRGIGAEIENTPAAVSGFRDYIDGIDGLPPSNMLYYEFANGASAVIRPSGTEPKLKAYISVSADSKDAAESAETAIHSWLDKIFSKD